MTVQTIYAGIGADFSAFRTEKHFASWLMLAPKRDVSGGKVIKHLSFGGNNRVANGLKMAARSLKESDSYLGARYRSLRGRLGGAVRGMARYLACRIYRMMTKGETYVDRGVAYFEKGGRTGIYSTSRGKLRLGACNWLLPFNLLRSTPGIRPTQRINVFRRDAEAAEEHGGRQIL